MFCNCRNVYGAGFGPRILVNPAIRNVACRRSARLSLLKKRPLLVPKVGPIKSGVQSLPPRKIRIIGVPLDLGASRRGVDMGPSAVRVAGLEARLEALGHNVADGGNISVAIAETKHVGDEDARYLKEITETCTRAADQVIEDSRSRNDAGDSWRRPFGCCGERLGSC